MPQINPKTNSRIRRGATMVETVTAASLAGLVSTALIATFLSGMQAWAKGTGKITADLESQSALKRISGELKEAMSVTVDGNGMGLSYRLPRQDEGGNFVVPPVWDGVNRRIEFNSGRKELAIVTGSRREIIAENVISKDVTNGNRDYRIFVPGSGAITRQITVMIVSETYGARREKVASRLRETLFVRNVPVLTR